MRILLTLAPMHRAIMRLFSPIVWMLNGLSNALLHLFRVRCGDCLGDLAHLACTSMYPHEVTGEPTPECDGFRWAARDEIAALCWKRMGQRLLALEW